MNRFERALASGEITTPPAIELANKRVETGRTEYIYDLNEQLGPPSAPGKYCSALDELGREHFFQSISWQDWGFEGGRPGYTYQPTGCGWVYQVRGNPNATWEPYDPDYCREVMGGLHEPF